VAITATPMILCILTLGYIDAVESLSSIGKDDNKVIITMPIVIKM
jgi:hypothetical protein